MAYSKYKFVGDGERYYKDKEVIARSYEGYFLIKLHKMFRYLNLPNTVPQYVLEHYLMKAGQCIFTKHEDRYFVFTGSRGEEPDVYYEGTKYIVANPALSLSKTYELYNKYHEPSEEAVLCKNDPYSMGLSPLLARYSWLLAENVITLRVSDVLLRLIALLNGTSDKEKAEAEQFLAKIDRGELAAIASNPFFDGIQMFSHQNSSNAYVTQFIELHQYYKGSFYNDIGLNANFNMKREAIGDSESALNEDVLMPLADEMLESRKEFCKRINEVFGLDIQVDFSSAWELNQRERIYQLETIKNESEVNNVSDGSGTQNENIENENGGEGTSDAQNENIENENIENENGGEGTSDAQNENENENGGEGTSDAQSENIENENGGEASSDTQNQNGNSAEDDESPEEEKGNAVPQEINVTVNVALDNATIETSEGESEEKNGSGGDSGNAESSENVSGD